MKARGARGECAASRWPQEDEKGADTDLSTASGRHSSVASRPTAHHDARPHVPEAKLLGSLTCLLDRGKLLA